ncbi:MAG TPA: sugar phosphate isomerase/epimerase family protein [Pseudothermotoga sp.]|uniref:sugar phosphate isomerase/epimerase family protein n=1 Tax=Thermotoga profunda TaxID=1508420 RepID=UPI000597B15E|nr:sugar phosphate isomerase/epimerase family protein [Thermotoga profunda]
MRLQNFQLKKLEMVKKFLEFKTKYPEKMVRRFDLSWSVWMFGRESLEKSLYRLKSNGINFVELKGDSYSDEISPKVDRVRETLKAVDVKVSGVCGLYSQNNDLSSSNPYIRQNAIDYVKRQINFAESVGGRYLIVVPSAVGKTKPEDDYDLSRSVETLRICAKYFERSTVKAAIEPIRSAEVSLIHTVDQAISYIKAVDHPAIYYINGDIYHMLCEENDIASAIIKCSDRLINLHIADSNRDGPGKGMIDLDLVIMAAYLVGMNQEGRFITFEPLGPYADPYVLANSSPDESVMNNLVRESVTYFRQREEAVREMTESDIEFAIL